MTWEEFQPYLKHLNGQAMITVSREKIKAIIKEMHNIKEWEVGDIIMNCSGIKNARWTGWIGWMYRVPDPNGGGTLGRVPTIALEGNLIYSENDVEGRFGEKSIIVPIEAIEAVKI